MSWFKIRCTIPSYAFGFSRLGGEFLPHPCKKEHVPFCLLRFQQRHADHGRGEGCSWEGWSVAGCRCCCCRLQMLLLQVLPAWQCEGLAFAGHRQCYRRPASCAFCSLSLPLTSATRLLAPWRGTKSKQNLPWHSFISSLPFKSNRSCNYIWMAGLQNCRLPKAEPVWSDFPVQDPAEWGPKPNLQPLGTTVISLI